MVVFTAAEGSLFGLKYCSLALLRDIYWAVWAIRAIRNRGILESSFGI